MTQVQPHASSRQALPATEEESIALVDELCLRYRNWGRWGDTDQRGTLNFIAPEALVYAATMIRSGRVVSYGLPFNGNGSQKGGFGGRTSPVLLSAGVRPSRCPVCWPKMTLEGVVEQITVPFLVTREEEDRQIPMEYAIAQYENAINSPDL
jgi:hypothetical protein